MQDFENNNNENTEGNSVGDSFSAGNGNDASDNGCTYHSGPIKSDSEQNSYNNEPNSDTAYPYGNNTVNNNQDNGYSRPYNANQYPYGQQNRQYSTNGQPPIGNSYSYSADNGNTPKRNRHGGKKNVGLIIFAVTLCLIAITAILGVFGVLTVKKNPSVNKNTEELTQSGVPKLDIESSPVNAGSKETDNELSANEVYKKVKDISVGVMIYSKDTKKLVSEGSGIILGENDQGNETYIITCAHVINTENSTFKVLLSDSTTYDAKIVGYDTRTDIGLLKISASGLSKAEFGSVDTLEVGQSVYAIGNPGGSEFAGSFTNGMISAIARPVSSNTGYTTKCIQHTAAINPGNSGGALVNSYGQIIGINSVKIVQTGYEGIGFAVPSDIVKEVVDKLIVYGYIPNRAKLGITYRPASSYETYSMVVQIKGLAKGSLVIESISSDSPLTATEVKSGDMIVAVNGKKLDTTDMLPSIIEKSSVNDTLILSIVRINDDYSLREFNVKIKLVQDKGSAAATEAD